MLRTFNTKALQMQHELLICAHLFKTMVYQESEYNNEFLYKHISAQHELFSVRVS